jgi:hypothetical protein
MYGTKADSAASAASPLVSTTIRRRDLAELDAQIRSALTIYDIGSLRAG